MNTYTHYQEKAAEAGGIFSKTDLAISNKIMEDISPVFDAIPSSAKKAEAENYLLDLLNNKGVIKRGDFFELKERIEVAMNSSSPPKSLPLEEIPKEAKKMKRKDKGKEKDVSEEEEVYEEPDSEEELFADDDIIGESAIPMEHLKGNDYVDHLNKVRKQAIKRIKDRIKQRGSQKVFLGYYCEFEKTGYNEDEDEVIQLGKPVKHYFSTVRGIGSPSIVLSTSNIEKKVDKLMSALISMVEEFTANGSGWEFKSSFQLYVLGADYKPMRGKSYIISPEWIRDKKCAINVQNKDDKCFMWSVLAGLYAPDRNKERVSNYQTKVRNGRNLARDEDGRVVVEPIGDLNWEGINFPPDKKDYKRFEKINPDVSLNIFMAGNKADSIAIIYKTTRERGRHVDLAIINNPNNSHFITITNFTSFASLITRGHGGECFACKTCLQSFKSEKKYLKHKEDCDLKDPMRIRMPEEGDTITFTNNKAEQKAPFVVYADFECITPGDHSPSGYCYKVVSEYPKYSNLIPLRHYSGEDCMEHFFSELMEDEATIRKVVNQNKPMRLTGEQQKSYSKATHCHICKEDLGTRMKWQTKKGHCWWCNGKHNSNKCPVEKVEGWEKIKCKQCKRNGHTEKDCWFEEREVKDVVRDHDHINGKFRGPAHNKCNMNLNLKGWKLPVFFHNLSGYDSHVIMNALKHCSYEPQPIAQTFEKYISFDLGPIRFLDSFRFMSSALGRLSDNLWEGGKGKDKFVETVKHFGKRNLSWVTRKGVYPYEYMDSFEKFEETQLPPIEAFYSKVSGCGISQEDYDYALKMWTRFKCKNLWDYHDLYLKTDVLILADVFQSFRETCHKAYGLDPVHFFTAPGLAWNAMLKKTGITIENMTDYDMYLMTEKGIRGGMCMVSHRFARANNPAVEGYDESKPNSHIMYLDANNLYGYSMIQSLPTGGYKWVKPDCWDAKRIAKYDPDSKYGYIMEVDLEYPAELHKLHDDYPLAPEGTAFPDSPYMEDLKKVIGNKTVKTPKLIPNLNDKEKYVIHIRNLKQYLELGMKLKKIHRIIRHNQSKWLKPYIDYNTSMRTQSKNAFEKDFFKLMNNAVFGKFMENVRNRLDVKLPRSDAKALKMIASPLCKRFQPKFCADEVPCIQMMRKEVVLNKPIAIGFCILDLSKTLMYDFHYNYMKPEYGERVKLLYTDTDSFIYHVETEDFYADMVLDCALYDTSDYPADHFLHSNINKKVIGKMKDEMNGKPIHQFVGLRPKLYSVLTDTYQINKAKGVKKSCMKNIKHDNYTRCLFGGNKEDMVQHCSFSNIVSKKHQLATVDQTKISMSCIEDKRYYLDMINSRAHGHYLNKQ